MVEAWQSLATTTQDILLLVALLIPALAVGVALHWGYRVSPLLIGLLRRHAWLCGTFVALIALSVAMGAGITAQERGLREGSARAAEKFDIVVAAPGSPYSAMLATVFLETQVLPLLGGEVYDAVANHPNVALAAPIAFGDSYQGAPVVGTTGEFVTHLAGGLTQGRMFETISEAVLGADIPLDLGDSFEPVHGDGSQGVLDEHGFAYTAVGRMPPTGSPWDKAILVAVESVWDVHSLPTGHGPDWDGALGPPFIADEFPGTPAILVRASEFWANYALRAEFTTEDTMAFFPGTVLSELYTVMGDVRRVMSVLSVVTLTLVAVSVLIGLAMLMRLLAPRLALLHAMGAPRRFALAVTWSLAALLIATGALLGLILALFAVQWISAQISAQTDITVKAHLSWAEIHLAAGFVSLASLLALIPAALAASRGFGQIRA
ncbi:MAG: ABC transporter permease [Pseudomonadota bacterium]